jgi:hypothetical protein
MFHRNVGTHCRAESRGDAVSSCHGPSQPNTARITDDFLPQSSCHLIIGSPVIILASGKSC